MAIALEREYNIPLRREFLKVARHKRAKKATKALKEFLAKHMKAEFEDIKISKWVNQEIWKRGIKNPPHHVKVKAVKDDKGIVQVELAVLPKCAVEEKKQQEAKSKEKKKEEKIGIKEAVTQKAPEIVKEMKEANKVIKEGRQGKELSKEEQEAEKEKTRILHDKKMVEGHLR